MFASEGIIWRYQGKRIERALTALVSKNLQEVRALLSDPRFEGPDEHFSKAVGFLSQPPEPDWENCVKDATEATEGVARTVSGNVKGVDPK